MQDLDLVLVPFQECVNGGLGVLIFVREVALQYRSGEGRLV